jgi:hypothetical protein
VAPACTPAFIWAHAGVDNATAAHTAATSNDPGAANAFIDKLLVTRTAARDHRIAQWGKIVATHTRSNDRLASGPLIGEDKDGNLMGARACAELLRIGRVAHGGR